MAGDTNVSSCIHAKEMMATCASVQGQAAYSILLNAVKEVMTECDSLRQQSTTATDSFDVARRMYQWLQGNEESRLGQEFAQSLVKMLRECIPGVEKYKSFRTRREWMWTNYHQLRCSASYAVAWKSFLCASLIAPGECPSILSIPIYWQSVGDKIFQTVLKEQFPLVETEERLSRDESITEMEVKALRYAAGYVPRAIRQKLKASQNTRNEQLLLCLYDLLDDGDEDNGTSTEWINLLDRGGLTHVNEMTFQVFVAMELELRKYLSAQKLPNLSVAIISPKLKENDDVQFYWSLVSCDWDERNSEVLLDEIIKLFITIRGFSYASAWLEQYKTANAKTLEKSKGLRKKLLSTTCTSDVSNNKS